MEPKEPANAESIPTQEPPIPTLSQQASLPNQEIAATSRKKRFVNYVIDRILSFYLAYIIVTISALAYGLLHFSYGSFTSWEIYVCIFIPSIFLYYYLSERFLGRTLGKYITSTQVVDKMNKKLTSGQIIKRTIARLIPFNEFSLFNQTRLTWHDRLSCTKVVSSSLLPKEMQPHWNKTIKLATILLLLLLPGGFLGYVLYQDATGGERYQLPQPMPDRMQLTAFKTVQDSGAAYFIFTYTGIHQSLQITRLIAGYNFDPSVKCNYTIPTFNGINITPISTNLKCTEIGKSSKMIAFAYQVTSTSTDPAIQQETPNFYFDIPPYRYMIKALKGNITRDEILLMLNNLTEITTQTLNNQIIINHKT